MTENTKRKDSAMHTVRLAQSNGSLQILLDDFPIKFVQSYQITGDGVNAILSLKILVSRVKASYESNEGDNDMREYMEIIEHIAVKYATLTEKRIDEALKSEDGITDMLLHEINDGIRILNHIATTYQKIVQMGTVPSEVH